ncbi:unnamed protein product, partial [Didymodactylos carnosus]
MMLLHLLIFSIIATVTSKKSYDGHIVISVTPFEESHYKLLSALEERKEIDIWNEIRRNASVDVMIHQKNKASWMKVFASLGMKPSMVIDDVQKLLNSEQQMLNIQSRSGIRGVTDTFLTYDEINAYLKQMESEYPGLAAVQSIGLTVENRNLNLIKIGSPSARRNAFLDCGIHAREWISPATCLYMINEFLTGYSKGGDAKQILDTYTLHILPLLNPDGYAYSHSRDRMWRKNRKPVGSNCFGVDLNRNFGYMWNTGGSSASPCSDTFHGGAAMSENEAKAMQSYMTNKPWDTYLTFHSYGQWWFTNWGYTNTLPPGYTELVAKAKIGADALRSVNGRSYTIGSSAVLLYVASGGSEDWTRGALNIKYSYCLELPPTGGTGFIAPISEIKKT